MSIRIGQGYDSHRMTEGNGLRIGGIDIACEYSFIAHSDGDVLIHAIIDAIFGAAKLGDIGKHFPDNDEEYRGIDSMKLLDKAGSILREAGYEIINIDSTIILERPKLKDYIEKIEANLERALELQAGTVSVKAKTDEGLGEVGHSKAARCYVSVLIEKTLKK